MLSSASSCTNPFFEIFGSETLIVKYFALSEVFAKQLQALTAMQYKFGFVQRIVCLHESIKIEATSRTVAEHLICETFRLLGYIDKYIAVVSKHNYHQAKSVAHRRAQMA